MQFSFQGDGIWEEDQSGKSLTSRDEALVTQYMRHTMKNLSILLCIVVLACASIGARAQNGSWLKYTAANSGLLSDTISAIAFDNSGNTWIASAADGLSKFDGTRWTSFNDMSKVPANTITSLLFFKGKLYVGTAYGVTEFDGTSWRTLNTDNSKLISNTVNCLAADANGNIWVATSSGLTEIKADGTMVNFDDTNIPIFPSAKIYALAVGRFNEIWVGFGSGSGMVHFNTNNLAAAVRIDENTISNFPPDHFNSIVADWNDDIWGSGEYTGFVKIHGTTATVYSKTNDPNWIDDKGHAVAVDRCGHVWLGSEGGAAMLEGSNWIDYTKTNSIMPHNTVSAISVDNAGHVWFGTYGGVVEYKPLPQQVTLLSPAHQAVVTTDISNCQWNWDCPGILKYWFEIADNANFNNSKIDTTSASLTQAASHLDSNFVNHMTYYWRVKAMNDAGWGSMSNVRSFTISKAGVEQGMNMMQNCTIGQNYPNPCGDLTTIHMSMTSHAQVSLKLYDMLGRPCATLVDGAMGPGEFDIQVNTGFLKDCGMYIYRLQSASSSDQRMMQVMR
jgi:hypothetical protein